MSTKKCPKCGEENPAEAVMCWACYTPLSSGPAIAGAAGGPKAAAGMPGTLPKGAGPAVGDEEAEKKQVDPKLFLAIGLLCLAGVVGLFTTGVVGGSPSDDGGTAITEPAPGGGAEIPPAEAPPSGGGSGPSTGPALATGGATGEKGADKIPYTTVVPPNARNATGTMGILANDTNISAAQAGGLARFARDHYSRTGKWSRMQIAVFTDQAAAQEFALYQLRRKGQALSASDYQQLAQSGVWAGAPGFYESAGKRETVYAPSQNPQSWWTSKPVSSRGAG